MPTLFNSPTTRIARSGDIPVWDARLNQWVPQSSTHAPLSAFPTVSGSGGALVNPVIKSGSTAFVANGSTQFFVISFPQGFNTISTAVIAQQSTATGSWVNINGFNITTITVQILSSALGFLPNTTAFSIDWIAVGT